MVKNKAFRFVPFDIDHPDYARCQRRLHSASIEEFNAFGGRIRIVELKPRQLGSTTYWMLLLLWMGICRETASQGIVVTDKDEKTIAILGRMYDAIRMMPRWIAPKIPKKPAEDRIGFLGWANAGLERPPCSSWIMTETAGGKRGKGLGHSYSFNMALLSEFSRYGEQAEEIVGGLRSGFSEQASASVFAIESTAYGYGGHFYEECRRAAKGESGYRFFFIPWHEVDEYKLRSVDDNARKMARNGFSPLDFIVAADGRRVECLTEEERDLLADFPHLDGSQLLWRRWAIQEKAGGDLQRFNQEFPARVRDAFIASGSSTFSASAIERLRKRDVRPPLAMGELEFDPDGVLRFVEYPNGRIRVWQRPIPGHEYIVVGDPAAGAEGDMNLADARNTDRSACEVFDRHAREQALEIAGRYPPDEFAQMYLRVLLWYNEGLAVPEVNGGYGLEILRVLKDARYPNIYVRLVRDQQKQEITQLLGWYTSTSVREFMFVVARSVVRMLTFHPHSEDLLHEMQAMINKPLANGNVRPDHPIGEHDDRAVAMAIALTVDREMGELAATPEEAPLLYDPNDPRSIVWKALLDRQRNLRGAGLY